MKKIVVALFASLAFAAAAHAHHGWSNYQGGEAMTLSGTIVEVAFSYPHSTIRLQTEDKTWLVVLAPPSRMSARGLPGDMLKPGDSAAVEGYAHRRDPIELRAERITIAGKTVELR
ncbi:MAG: DUF6152 family protein [Burkholderiales bacterium]